MSLWCYCLFKVPPAELEAILDAHPAVADACVVGIMHPDDGEVPKAFVALKPDAKVTKEELQQFVAGRHTANNAQLIARNSLQYKQ